MRRHKREAAYVDFVSARQTHWRRVAYAVCGDWHLAEDVLQTSLVKLYLAWPRLVRDGAEDAYLRRIIVRTAIDESRRPWRREQPTDEHEDRPDLVTDAREDRSELVAALLTLPPQQRACVVLRHWLDLSVRDTAQELGISEGSVKTHTSRALEKLQLALTPGDDDGPA